MALQNTLDGFAAALAHVGTTGAVRYADLGSPVPRMEPSFDDGIFTNMGYIGPDGIEVSFDEDATEFIPFQEIAPIRREITKSITAIKFVLWQTSRKNLSFFLGGEVQEDGQGGWYIDVGGKPKFDRKLFVVDVVDGDDAARIILPNAQLTERGSVTFKSDEIIGLEVTITAYPADASEYPDDPTIAGKQSRWYFSESWDESGAVGSETGGGALSIATTALPVGTVGTPYTAKLVASGGVGSVLWEIAGGTTLPEGLDLSTDGTISGTPTAAGETDLTLRVEDLADNAAEKKVTLTISNSAP